MRSKIMKKNNYLLAFKIIQITFCIILSSAYLHSQQGLEIKPIKTDFGEVRYMDTKTLKVVLKNTWDTTLIIDRMDSLKKPFSAIFNCPDSIPKNDSLVYDISYQPEKAEIDSQRVYLDLSYIRSHHSIGMLFDVSGSMIDKIDGLGMSKLEAADTAGKKFIESIPEFPDVWDEVGIFTFSSSFTIAQDFTTDKAKLINALPKITRTTTVLYDACVQAVNLVAKRPYEKVIILLTDGKDKYSNRYNKNDVINQAIANNVKIYAVGVGSNTQDNILTDIAVSSGGLFFKANTYKDLIDIYSQIFKLLTNKKSIFFDVVGKCNTPLLSIDCDSNTNVSPGDTVTYTFHLKAVSRIATMDSTFKLRIRFDHSLLLPLDSNITYNKGDKIEITRVNKVNLDSFPLIKVKFKAFLSDPMCSEIKIESLEWVNSGYYPIFTNSICKVCVKVCAGTLRAIQSFQPLYLYQNTPNPFSNSTDVNFEVNEEGRYCLNIYDTYGRIIKNIFDSQYKPGTYKTNISGTDFNPGTYLYVLNTPSGVLSRIMVVSK